MAMNDEGDHFKEMNNDLKELEEKVWSEKTWQLKYSHVFTQQLHHHELTNCHHLE